jgi:hypothetical protein
MPLLATIVLTALLLVLAVLLHYEALLHSSRLAGRMTIPPRRRILVVIAAAVLAHLAEIALFAAAYLGMEQAGLGTVTGAQEGNLVDHFYFSATMFTTLGVGDQVPTGPLRVTAGMESLIGLVLITWTASFSYLAMERFWGDH